MTTIVNPYQKRKPVSAPSVDSSERIVPTKKCRQTDSNERNNPTKKCKQTFETTAQNEFSLATTNDCIIETKAKKYVQSITTRIPNCLGRLRTREGIDFQWIGPPVVSKNNVIGRVYFQGFHLSGNSYFVDGIVAMKTSYLNETVRIVSVFQATKSYIGTVYDDCFEEIQKRGGYNMYTFPNIMR
jgi:hypothetical protein